MTFRGVLALVCGLLASGTAPAFAAGNGFDQQVLAALNAARTDPQGMAEALRAYRTLFRGKSVRFPGNPVALLTQEGGAPVDEAIDFLMRQRALPPLTTAEGLAQGATEHVADQGALGLVSHIGTDGSSPSDRIRRHRGQDNVAEVVQFGAAEPFDVIRQLIVDDGVASRGHRRILFDPTLRFAGVACGRHRDYGMMCVIDLAAGSSGSRSAQADAPTRVALQAPR